MPSAFNTAYRKLYRGVQIGARIGVFAVTIVAFICAVIIGLTQLESFRGWAIGEGLAALNNQLQGRVEVDGISGNVLTGLKLTGVRLFADGTTMIEAPVVELAYTLRPIFEQKVVGARAVLHRPIVRLIRNERDSVWNFNRITKPSLDTLKTPFNWDIDVQAFEIVDGTVLINDRTAPPDLDTIARHVDYTHLELHDVNLALQAHIAPTSQSIWLQNLAFNAPQPDVRVLEISTQVTVDKTGLTVKDLVVETERTLLRLDGRIDSVDFVGDATAIRPWQDFPITLSLDAPRVSTLELRRFVGEDLDFLAGTPALELDAKGSFGDLAIQKLRLGLPRTDLHVTGRLRNMNEPDSLAIDAQIEDSYVTYADVMQHLPGLGLPDLTYLGRAEIRSASFNGLPELFTATLDASTAIGSTKGGAWLDLRGERMIYTADLAFEHVDFAPLAQDPSLESDFTGRIVTNGAGTSLDELAARVRLESQGSTVAGRSYRMLYFDGGIGDGGFITADTLLVAWGTGGGSPTSTQPALATLVRTLSRGRDSYVTSQLPLTGTVRSIAASNPSLGAGGWLDLSAPSKPKYDLDLRAHDVDLAEVLLDPEYRSDLTFVASVKGTGFDPDDIDGTGRLVVSPSTVGGESIPATNATVTLKQLGGGQRSLVLESDVADARVNGTWSFETLVNSAARGAGALVDFASRTSRYQPEPVTPSGTTIATPIAATYELDIKDLSRLSGFIKGADLSAKGRINGEITGNSRALDISVLGKLDQLRYVQGSTNLSLGAVQLDVRLGGITPYGITSATSGSIRVQSDSLLRFGDMTFTIPSMAIDLHSGLIDVRGATVINKEISLAVHGQIDASNPAGYLVRFDTLLVSMPEPMYSWHNVGTVEAVISNDFVRIDSLTIQRANAEIINVSGALAGDKLDNVQIKIVSASIADITSLMRSPDDVYGVADMGGRISNGVVTLNGTLDNPIISGQLAIDSVIYSGSRVGNFVANFSYSDLDASGKIILSEVAIGGDTMSVPAIIDVRSLPLDLALASREERLINGRPIDVSVQTKDMPVAFLAPFVPGIRLQRGTATLDFTIGGTLPDADYHGSVDMRNVWGTVEATNVLYRLNGRATFKDNVLAIERMLVQNDPRELAESGAEVTGKIYFEGLEPSDLDLNVSARRLLVLSEATEAADLGIYGDVVIRTGSRPLSLTGTLASPRLQGDVVVLSGDLTIPNSTGRSSDEDIITFIPYDDWMRITRTTYGPELPDIIETIDTVGRPAGASPSAGQIDRTVRGGSLQQAAADMRPFFDSARARSLAPTPGFVDALSADLNISMERPLSIRMDMGPFEQLRLEIKQQGRDVNFEMRPGEVPKLFGKFSIEPGSEYTYIKKFEATGEVDFRGPITDPRFAVNARYTGRRYNGEGGASQDYEVTVAINGTPENLGRPEFNYTIAGQTPSSDPQVRFQNAISLLLFGRTSDELRATGVGSHVQALAQSAVSSGTSTFASAALSDAFAGSFVRSFDIEFGDNIDQTRLNFVSQFGKIVFRYGGEVANPSVGLASLEVPLTAFKDAESLRNYIFQFQREVRSSSESVLRSGGGTSQTETWRIRFQIRITL
jgi:hypothetical protein